MTTSNEQRPWPEPMPQSGVYPVGQICSWLGLTRAEFEERAARNGLVIDADDCIEMADLIAAVRRKQDLQEGSSDG